MKFFVVLPLLFTNVVTWANVLTQEYECSKKAREAAASVERIARLAKGDDGDKITKIEIDKASVKEVNHYLARIEYIVTILGSTYSMDITRNCKIANISLKNYDKKFPGLNLDKFIYPIYAAAMVHAISRNMNLNYFFDKMTMYKYQSGLFDFGKPDYHWYGDIAENTNLEGEYKIKLCDEKKSRICYLDMGIESNFHKM